MKRGWTADGGRVVLGEAAVLREALLEQGRPVAEIAEAIAARLGVSLLKAQRLARGWTRPHTVERILATYDEDGLARPALKPHRLCGWEHGQQRPGEDYLDRLCRVYRTRADRLGYGHDYTPAPQPEHAEPSAQPATAYPGPAAAPTPAEGGCCGARGQAQGEGEEAATDRHEFLHATGLAGVAALLERAGRGAVRLSGKLGASNLGAATLDQLDLRVAGFMQGFQDTPWDELFRAVLAEQERVEALLDGSQPLRQRRRLHRVAAQLSALSGAVAFNLGDQPTAQAQLLTAWQLAEEIGDRDLAATVRVNQSTAALWGGDFASALGFAEDGQRYASGPRSAQLAGRCEARAHARMGQRTPALSALRRIEAAMPAQPVAEDPGGGWSVFSPAAAELYTAITLLWLGQPADAEPHAREAITCYQSQPPPLHSPANHAQAQITLAACLARRDQPEQAIDTAAQALGTGQGHVEANLRQAAEFLAALPPSHRGLPAAREFAEQLHAIRPPHPILN